MRKIEMKIFIKKNKLEDSFCFYSFLSIFSFSSSSFCLDLMISIQRYQKYTFFSEKNTFYFAVHR